jgi:hypothetical protein
MCALAANLERVMGALNIPSAATASTATASTATASTAAASTAAAVVAATPAAEVAASVMSSADDEGVDVRDGAEDRF